MVDEGERWQGLIEGLRAGDRRVLAELWRQYGPLLRIVADKHLGAHLRRRVGPESVVQSACRTFLRRAREGDYEIADSDSLWRLLCAITLYKVREQVRFHTRQKRGIDREVYVDGVSGFDAPSPGPSPAEAAVFGEQLEQVFAALGDEEREIVELKLQDVDNREIAGRIGCSERTVRRILARVRQRLERTFGGRT